MEWEYNVFIPSLNTTIYMQDGDGSNLDKDDYDAGYDAYIDYSIVEGKNEGDGGLYLYNAEEAAKKSKGHIFEWTEKIEDAIRYIFDIPDNEKCLEYKLKEVA